MEQHVDEGAVELQEIDSLTITHEANEAEDHDDFQEVAPPPSISDQPFSIVNSYEATAKVHVLLGNRYEESSCEEFRRDFSSIIWLSYRSGFPSMHPYHFTEDAGWGCMLRCSQMMIAQALQRSMLGRDWRVPQLLTDRQSCESYCQILKWFIDCPGDRHMFSIHNMVQFGMQYDKLPGEWYGPTAASYVLRDLLIVHKYRYGGNLILHVAQEGALYIDKIDELCKSDMKSDEVEEETKRIDEGSSGKICDPLINPPLLVNREWEMSAILVIPVRLGVRNINEEYNGGLFKLLAIPQTLGFLGGRPSHALYFVGHDGTNLIGLDPHCVQPSTTYDHDFPTTEYLRSVHRSEWTCTPLQNLDPSLVLAFFCRDREDFEDLIQRCKEIGKSEKLPFEIACSAPTYEWNSDLESLIRNTPEVDGESDIEDEYVVI